MPEQRPPLQRLVGLVAISLLVLAATVVLAAQVGRAIGHALVPAEAADGDPGGRWPGDQGDG